jgi:hypothetical protein
MSIWADVPPVAERLGDGQKFNAYETAGGSYAICIGPVTDCLMLAHTTHAQAADLIVEALRIASNQPPALALMQ